MTNTRELDARMAAVEEELNILPLPQKAPGEEEVELISSRLRQAQRLRSEGNEEGALQALSRQGFVF